MVGEQLGKGMWKIFRALLPDFSKNFDLAFVYSIKFSIPKILYLNNCHLNGAL